MIAIGQRIIWALAIFVSGVVTREAIAQCPDLGPNPTPSASVSIEPEGVPVLTVTHGFDGVYARHSGGYTKHLALDWQLDSAGCPMSYVHPPLSLWPLLSSGDWEIWSDDPTWSNSVFLKTVTLAKKPILKPERVEWNAQFDLWLHLDYKLTGPIETSYKAFFSTRLLDKDKKEIRDTYTQQSAHKLTRTGTASKVLENWWGYVPQEAVYVRYYFHPANREGVSGDVPIPPLPPKPSNIQLGLDLHEALYPQGLKMLVAKHRPDDPTDTFPRAEQLDPDEKGRPRFRITGSVRDAATGAPPSNETPVYLRLRDPKDPSLYIPSGLATEGDNADKTATISSTDGASAGVCVGTACATSDILTIKVPAGKEVFEVTLTGSTFAAGDNYEIEASLEPDGTCPTTTGCAKSPTITMWKRIYVERTNMFRSGGQLSEDIDPTQKGPVSKVHVTPAKSFEPNQIVRFVHAPKLDGTGDQMYYYDDRKIVSTVATGSNTATLTLDQPLDRMYYARDAGAAPVSEDGADGVGVLVDGTYPEADLIITEDLLSRAFVEMVPLDATVNSTLPPLYKMSENAGLALGKKWFRNRARPNHFLLASAATNDLGDLGATHTLQRKTIWLYMHPAESYSLLAYVQRFTLMSEVASHEMGHGWAVNSDPTKLKILPSGHCGHPRFDDSSKACIMASSYFVEYPKTTAFDFDNNYPAPEFYNGTVNYHTNKVGSDFDSEFMEIRRREDPLPDR